MSNDKKPPVEAVSGGHNPDALDLLKIERRIDMLEREKTELGAKSKLTPGRRGQLAKVSKELLELGWARVVATEHVRANPYQSEIYDREQAVAMRDAKREERHTDRQQKSAQADQRSYVEKYRSYVASWKNKQAEEKSEPVKSNDSEVEQEPE